MASQQDNPAYKALVADMGPLFVELKNTQSVSPGYFFDDFAKQKKVIPCLKIVDYFKELSISTLRDILFLIPRIGTGDSTQTEDAARCVIGALIAYLDKALKLTDGDVKVTISEKMLAFYKDFGFVERTSEVTSEYGEKLRGVETGVTQAGQNTADAKSITKAILSAFNCGNDAAAITAKLDSIATDQYDQKALATACYACLGVFKKHELLSARFIATTDVFGPSFVMAKERFEALLKGMESHGPLLAGLGAVLHCVYKDGTKAYAGVVNKWLVHRLHFAKMPIFAQMFRSCRHYGISADILFNKTILKETAESWRRLGRFAKLMNDNTDNPMRVAGFAFGRLIDDRLFGAYATSLNRRLYCILAIIADHENHLKVGMLASISDFEFNEVKGFADFVKHSLVRFEASSNEFGNIEYAEYVARKTRGPTLAIETKPTPSVMPGGATDREKALIAESNLKAKATNAVLNKHADLFQ